VSDAAAAPRFSSVTLAEPATRRMADEPVLVFEDAIADPRALVNFAVGHTRFDDAGTASGGYPGIAAPAPIDYARALVRAADPYVRRTWMLEDVTLGHATCRLSIVTRPPATLTPLQRVPHVDTTDPLQFAFLHYLTDIGGTGFYRHVTSGLSIISDAVAKDYDARRDAELAAAIPDPRYIEQGSATYAQIGMVEARFNRLIVYRSSLLHSGIVPPDASLSPDPRMGRLTANIFLSYRQH
jgi:hypothetical protein